MSSSDLSPGALFHGRYQIGRAIRSGGMGEVYRATDKHTGMVVAIKRMLVDVPEGADQGALYHLQRFEEECKLLQNLAYPGIPAFVETFQEDQRSVIVMEFIEGVDLEKQVADQMSLAGTYLPLTQAVEFTIGVARILEFMHAHRPRPVIHRDVKPANIIVRHSDNRIYLVDFGLAREVGGSTATKTAVGTAGYAPVEQYKGRPTTRTDQFSLGATLHFMLSGQHPLPLQLEPLDKVRADLPHELCWVVRKATMPEQEDRYDSIYEFRRELEQLLPLLRDAEREQQVLEVNQTRIQLMPPTQSLPDLERRPAQRVKVEGMHAAPPDPMADFGLSNPLKRDGANQAEFQRQAMQADRERREPTLPQDERRGPGLHLWRWLAMLLLLAGVGVLVRLNRTAQHDLAERLGLPGHPVLQQAGLVEAGSDVLLGRQDMGWLECLLAFPLPEHDGVVFTLPDNLAGPAKLTAPRQRFDDRAVLLLALLDASRRPLASWLIRRDSAGALSARPAELPPGKAIDLSTRAEPSAPPLLNEAQLNQDVLLVPLPKTLSATPRVGILSVQTPGDQPVGVSLSIGTRL